MRTALDRPTDRPTDKCGGGSGPIGAAYACLWPVASPSSSARAAGEREQCTLSQTATARATTPVRDEYDRGCTNSGGSAFRAEWRKRQTHAAPCRPMNSSQCLCEGCGSAREMHRTYRTFCAHHHADHERATHTHATLPSSVACERAGRRGLPPRPATSRACRTPASGAEAGRSPYLRFVWCVCAAAAPARASYRLPALLCTRARANSAAQHERVGTTTYMRARRHFARAHIESTIEYLRGRTLRARKVGTLGVRGLQLVPAIGAPGAPSTPERHSDARARLNNPDARTRVSTKSETTYLRFAPAEAESRVRMRSWRRRTRTQLCVRSQHTQRHCVAPLHL